MISDFKKYKENVMEIYERFVPLAKEVRQERERNYDSALKTLEIQAENIRQDKFLLMVVGEAKSGKSTFINAYLGKEILPMDVKQCTSAIVEIRYGEKYSLTATYADDTTDVFEDENQIKNFLKENAALDDKYRDIPVSIINIELLMKKGDKKIYNEEIKDLLKGIQDQNLHHLPIDEYEDKVKQYIKDKQPHWKEIVKKIEINYPFEDEDLKYIEIVDSPGVNAEGRVGDITNEYIEKANAVMFLKPITGAALEATSFKKFLDSKSADRNKGAMFLILTRSANETEANIKRIYEEALLQFPSIKREQIIPVDSKVEMFINQTQNMTNEELRAYLMQKVGEKDLDAFLLAPWFTAQYDRDRYLEKLRELSNFAAVDYSLNLFAHKAQYLALSEFLGRMIGILDIMKDQLNEDIENNRLKMDDPIELANKLGNIKTKLNELMLKLNGTVNDIADSYTTKEGDKYKEIMSEVDAEMGKFRKQIKDITPSAENSLDQLEKFTFQKIDIFQEYEKKIQNDVVAECDEKLIEFSKEAEINYTVIKPSLTQETIKKIEEEQKKESYINQPYTTGLTFKKTHSNPTFSQSKYYNNVKDSIEKRLEKIKNDMISDLAGFAVQVTSVYREELARNAKSKQKEYDELLKAQKTAEDLQTAIAWMEGLFDDVTKLSVEMGGLKGGIDTNVGAN